MVASPTNSPFRLDFAARTPMGYAARMSRPLLERLLAFPALNSVYADTRNRDERLCFEDRVLAALGVRYQVEAVDLGRIPRTGPLVVVANHPFGGVEGLVLGSLLASVRPDAKIMANYLLAVMPELRDAQIHVDPFGGPEAVRHNIAAIRRAVNWLRSGGAVGVFPSGEVSHLNLQRRTVTDPVWSDSIARIVLRTGATVLPVYFDGHNRWLFHALGLIHPRLRTAMLPRECLRMRDACVKLHIGSPIQPAQLERFASPREVIDYLRLRTYLLRSRAGGVARTAMHDQFAIHSKSHDAGASADVVGDVNALPRPQVLLASGDYRIVYARAAQIPNLLNEIGRLREHTFRLVGEGTGKEIDLDPFDQDYLHLVLWDDARRCVAGSYRMGPTDEILPRYGTRGLYTHTLFHIRPNLLERMGPGLELGRSFVAPAYQKNYSPLLLLWKGIGNFVARFPRYRCLFGAVSISDEYHCMTKQLLVNFMRTSGLRSDLSRFIRPRNALRHRRRFDLDHELVARVVKDLDEVNELIAEIESDQKTLPVLLRQYMKLNGKLLGFNVDPAFSNVLDGLMLVELDKVDRKILNRYFTPGGAEQFLAYHQSRRKDVTVPNSPVRFPSAGARAASARA